MGKTHFDEEDYRRALRNFWIITAVFTCILIMSIVIG